MSTFEHLVLKVDEKTYKSWKVNTFTRSGYNGPRMVSLRSLGIPDQRGLCPSMISLHSSRASRSETFAGNLYERSVRTAPRGEFGSAGGIKRTSLERISPCTRFESVTHEDNQLKKDKGGVPIDGPPRTRMISLDEPPSSETGSTKHALSNAEQMAFAPEPPDITVILGDVSGVSEDRVLVLERRSELLLLPRVASGCGLGFAG